MSRVSNAQLVALVESMGPRAWDVVETIERLKLVSHSQVARLLDYDGASRASAARMTRALLAQMTAAGLLGRLERRIGGVRAGSAGYVYYLGSVGQRALAMRRGEGVIRGRRAPEPGRAFVRHRLHVSEIYVRAHELQHRGAVEIIGFDVEPECWRRSLDSFGGSTTLKPDAYVRLAAGAYEDRWFVEVDLGTESRAVLRRKAAAYLDYFHSGQEQAESGVFPRVLWATSNEARRAVLVDVCAGLPAEYWSLFAVTTLENAAEWMAEQLVDEAHEPGAIGGAS